MAKRSLQTLGPQVAALRMLRTYVERIYAMWALNGEVLRVAM
jgi:hypothetical protein